MSVAVFGFGELELSSKSGDAIALGGLSQRRLLISQLAGSADVESDTRLLPEFIA